MKRSDIHKILIIGSGPIVIGQACEFDYSGTQACKALKKLGYEIVLVNSNPATIMTDPDTADATYIEPLNLERLTQIIEKERPDGLLPNLGGQSGLNLCAELNKTGVLEKYKVKVIGVQVDAIECGEDRVEFKNMMKALRISTARSEVAYSVEEALTIAGKLGYPVVVRPAYTMSGAGGGLAYNVDELKTAAERGIESSLVSQILVEESVYGWEELELEVIRDSKGQMITACAIENIDPMGVHTGDSFCTIPMLTVTEEVQQELQAMAYKIVDAIKIVGGTNVQFARNPATGRIVVIEINPRTSRSSALASKATGLPIAMVSAMLALGLNLCDIPCGKYGTLDHYIPEMDYVVIKMARWAFEKFKGAEDMLGTQMRAVGEVMSIGKTYKEAFQKAIRSLGNGRYGLGFVKDFGTKSKGDLLDLLHMPTSERPFIMYEALRKGASVEELYELTKIKPYFIEQMEELVQEEEIIKTFKGSVPPDDILRNAKSDGFSDKYLGMLLELPEKAVRDKRKTVGITEAWGGIPVSSTQSSQYYYSTYHRIGDASSRSDKPKIMILGGGPNQIGQGIEFDYSCTHAAYALKKQGLETIIVNCNPETVSTDYDTADKLYFEPLTVEDVLSIYEKEKPLGVIAQFGGQTPLNIAEELKENGVTILGTPPESINLAEDRDCFREIMEDLRIPMPESGMADTIGQALHVARGIGYPVMVRPSYVLGGQGMAIIHDDDDMVNYMNEAAGITSQRPVLIDRFLKNALECEADAICDGTDAFVPAIMEHIEQAGIHSGDSACVIPSLNITEENRKTIREYAVKIAKELKVCGLMNIQYAIENGVVYVLEVNPRASRTVPMVSKVCNIWMVKLAAEVITGELTGKPSPVSGFKECKITHYGVKEAVFPFHMFPEVDPVLGPEMRSTGEVLGLAETFGEAFYKAEEAANAKLPLTGTVLISVTDKDKTEALEVARGFAECGFRILATAGTYERIAAGQIPVDKIYKLNQGRPNILDAIINGKIDIIVNTPNDKKGINDDSYIRKAAIKMGISYVTTIAAAKASVSGIQTIKKNGILAVKSLQEFHKEMK